MCNAVRHINEENIFIFFDRVKHHFSNQVRYPIIFEIVLCYWHVSLQNSNHLICNFLLQRKIHSFWLFIVENIHPHISKVKFLQILPAILNCSQYFICTDISQGVTLKFKSSESTVDIGNNLLNVFDTFNSYVAVIERKFLYFWVCS